MEIETKLITIKHYYRKDYLKMYKIDIFFNYYNLTRIYIQEVQFFFLIAVYLKQNKNYSF